MLQSLSTLRGLQERCLFVQLDPSEHQAELVGLIASSGLPCKVELVCNPTRLGVRANPLRSLERAWEAGSTAFLLLEDDLEVSADALDFVRHCLQLPDWSHRYACGNLHLSSYFNHAHLSEWNPSGQELASVALEMYFLSSLGLFFSRNQYESLIRRYWWERGLHFRSFNGDRVDGWDCALNQALLLGSRPCLQSLLPRVRHCGVEGVHSDADWHQRSYAHAGLQSAQRLLPKVLVYRVDRLNIAPPGGESWAVLLRMAS